MSSIGKGAIALVLLTMVTLVVIVLFGEKKLLDSKSTPSRKVILPGSTGGKSLLSFGSQSAASVAQQAQSSSISSSTDATGVIDTLKSTLSKAIRGASSSSFSYPASSYSATSPDPEIAPPFTTAKYTSPAQLFALEGRRAPIQNGTFGRDPNALVPCVIGADWGHLYRRGKDYYMYKSFIPRNAILPTHGDDGAYAFVAVEVPNAVFALMFDDPRWCCVYVPAMHVPSGLFVGADVHFHDYLMRNVVHADKPWRGWRMRLDKDTEPIRHALPMTWWDKYYTSRASRPTKEEAALDAAMEAAKKIKMSDSNSSSSDNIINNNSNVSSALEALRRAANNDKAVHGEARRENVYINSSLLRAATGNRVLPVPVDTEYVHILVTDLVGMMPAVTCAMLLGYWAKFYSSGLQALGKDRITVVINRPEWLPGTNSRLLEEWTRFLPVPALYLPRNQTFYAKKLTFAPRGYNDVVEPAVFHFLHHWLVPTVVQQFRLALRNGRPTRFLNEDAAAMAPIPGSTDGAYDPVSRWPRRLLKDLGGRAQLRLPLEDPSQERPWWPAHYDALLRSPPENLAILKTREGAYSGRMLLPTDNFRRLMRQFNYTLVKDTVPQPIRMYLINHAKRLMIMWGGGGTIHSHLWGGGVSSSSSSAKNNKGPRFLDVIMLRQTAYAWEDCGFYSCPLKKHGVKMQTREKVVRGLKTWIGPPNPHDNVSEGPFSFHYAWTKLIELETLDLMRPEHMVISDAEKAADYSPYCRRRELEKEARGPHKTTRYEFGKEWGTDPW